MAWTMDVNGNYYEKGVDFWIKKVLKESKPKPVFYDVGSNFGYYSIKYHKLLKQGYAFEPVKSTFSFLRQNIQKNKIKKIKEFNLGLSNVSQDLTINIYNSSACNTIHERQIPDNHSIKKIGVETIRLEVLDELIKSENLLLPDIIKIDVEGTELQVLKGAKMIIESKQPIVVIEYSEATSNDAGYKRKKLLEFFNTDYYSFKGINADEKSIELIPFGAFETSSVGNVIAYPNVKEYLFK